MDNQEVSGLSGPMMPPKSGGKPKQLVIFLHGLGADGEDLIGLAPMFAEALPDAAFISPHAPFACDMAPYGYQWFSLRDWSPASMLAGAKGTAPVLNACIDAMMKQFGLTEQQVALVGFSQGCMMALYVALRRAKPLAGILGYSGALVGGEVLAAEIKAKPEICLVHGDEDPVVPYHALGMAESALKSAAVPMEAHTRPGLMHGIDPEGIEIGKRFLKRVFGL